jgi:exo-beta-1,3-glucanase (GH17 family)
MRLIVCLILTLICACSFAQGYANKSKTAKAILGNPNYQAICYGGYRTSSREVVPTVKEIKEDLKILAAANIKLLRTYNVHHKEIHNLLQAITQLKKEKNHFEMYVMLGAWIDCKNAWTKQPPIHTEESPRNKNEIAEAVRLAKTYPSIIKIIAVGNEAMVHWATNYYVTPNIILKWVNYLQSLKKQGKLSKNLWVTSSDNFASWGGGDSSYHQADLNKLIKAVDYISLHTYPMHDTHYNPTFWGIKLGEQTLSKEEKIEAVMKRSRDYAINQYNNVAQYVYKLGIKKPIHIGETGWATKCNELYGKQGSKATDEYKAAVYYRLMQEWASKQKISCFYFEAFDENWKNPDNPLHSENHFGFINKEGIAKYAFWNLVENGAFNGLTRNGQPISKSYNGKENLLWQDVELPTKILEK